jgi:hypothetical protein
VTVIALPEFVAEDLAAVDAPARELAYSIRGYPGNRDEKYEDGRNESFRFALTCEVAMAPRP